MLMENVPSLGVKRRVYYIFYLPTGNNRPNFFNESALTMLVALI